MVNILMLLSSLILINSSVLLRYFPAKNMPAFRQVGEKQLPNPVLCMAWSPKRDLIALANTAGEVGSNHSLCNISRHLLWCVIVCLFSVAATAPLG